MPAGATTIAVLDGGAVSRTMTVYSSTGAVTGLLSPLQGLLGADGATIVSASNGFPVTIENASIVVSPVNSAIKAGQTKIASTGTAVQLGTNTLLNGITVKSLVNNNAAGITVGGSSVTNTADGTGNGHILLPGDEIFLAVSNSNDVWVNGTTGDIISFAGN